MTCACETCPFENPPTDKIFYEIHVTVEMSDVEKFKSLCAEIDSKAIIIAFDKDTIPSQFMTSDNIPDDLLKTYARMSEVVNFFKSKGINVLRKKIETVPWHPDAKKKKLSKKQYFETHFGIELASQAEKELLKKEIPIHWSRNAFKKLEDGKFIQMGTLRLAECGATYFPLKAHYKRLITELGFCIKKEITEFCLYDSNLDLDKEWMKRYD